MIRLSHLPPDIESRLADAASYSLTGRPFFGFPQKLSWVARLDFDFGEPVVADLPYEVVIMTDKNFSYHVIGTPDEMSNIVNPLVNYITEDQWVPDIWLDQMAIFFSSRNPVTERLNPKETLHRGWRYDELDSVPRRGGLVPLPEYGQAAR